MKWVVLVVTKSEDSPNGLAVGLVSPDPVYGLGGKFHSQKVRVKGRVSNEDWIAPFNSAGHANTSSQKMKEEHPDCTYLVVPVEVEEWH